MTHRQGGSMAMELLTPQGAGNGEGIDTIPQTDFAEGPFVPRRTPDEAAVVGRYAIGFGSVLEVTPLSDQDLRTYNMSAN